MQHIYVGIKHTLHSCYFRWLSLGLQLLEPQFRAQFSVASVCVSCWKNKAKTLEEVHTQPKQNGKTKRNTMVNPSMWTKLPCLVNWTKT